MPYKDPRTRYLKSVERQQAGQCRQCGSPAYGYSRCARCRSLANLKRPPVTKVDLNLNLRRLIESMSGRVHDRRMSSGDPDSEGKIMFSSVGLWWATISR